MTDAVSTADVSARAASAPGESRLWVAARMTFPFLVVGAMWEITAHAGVFPARLFPTLEEIAAVSATPDENTLIASAGAIQVWRLTTGQIQVNAPGLEPEPTKLYVFVWAGCG